jgi:predicted membrane protein
METKDGRSTDVNKGQHHENFNDRSGRVWGGVALIIFGGLLLARRAGADLPYWLFSWEMIPIAIGLFIGARQSFRPGGWIIPILIGTAFLVDDMFPDVNMRHFIWPSIIILFGLFMIFRPRRKRDDYWKSWGEKGIVSTSSADTDEVLEMVSVFGGNKKNVISKNFKGGETVAVFGGNELILTQADFTGTAVLEMTQVFGGAKLIIPANWKVQSEIVSIFGGLDDKRPQATEYDSTKVLRLIGTSVFGGIEIKSY